MLIYDQEVCSLMSRRSSLRIINDKLYWEVDIQSQGTIKVLALPKALLNEVLHHLHDLHVTGHMEIRRTLLHVKQRFYWTLHVGVPSVLSVEDVRENQQQHVYQ